MKNTILFFLLVSVSILACTTPDPAVEAMNQLEADYQANPSAQTATPLLEAYNKQIEAKPADAATATYLLKSAEIQTEINRYSAALKTLNQLLKNHRTSPEAPKAAVLLATVYGEKLNNPDGALAVRQAFVGGFPNAAQVAEMKAAIPANTSDLSERILDTGKRIYNDSTNRIDFRVANDFIGMAEILAMIQPEHPKAAELLHDAGRAAGYLRTFPKALELYQWVIDKYPNDSNAAHAQFMMAYTYDNDMKDFDNARTHYETFLSKYPNDELAQSAKVLLDNLGVPDDQIIEKLQQKGK